MAAERRTRAIRRLDSGRSAWSERRVSSHPCRMRRLRWLSVLVPVVAVAIIELVSDGLLDAACSRSRSTRVVVVVRGGRPGVGLLRRWPFGGSTALAARAAGPQCRSRATRGLGTRAAPGQRRDRRPGRPRRDPPGDRRRGARPTRRRTSRSCACTAPMATGYVAAASGPEGRDRPRRWLPRRTTPSGSSAPTWRSPGSRRRSSAPERRSGS